jgi:hypothetical protein
MVSGQVRGNSEQPRVFDPESPTKKMPQTQALLSRIGLPQAPTNVSPALSLKIQRMSKLSGPPDGGRWTKRSTLLFILGTCGAFWGFVLWAIFAVIRH